MAAPKTTRTETDIELQRVKATVLVAEQDDALRAADRAVEEAQTRRADAEAKKAAALREVARLDAEAKALAGDHGPVVRELAELTAATRASVETATRSLAALSEAVATLDSQTARGAYLTEQARALGAVVGPWPQPMDVRPYVTRTDGLSGPLSQYLAQRAEGLR